MRTRPLVFDDTALIALFDSQPRVFALWQAAEESSVPILLPACAMHAANVQLKASDNAWEALLLQPNVLVLDLTGSSALSAGRFGGHAAIAHSYVEAVNSDAYILTSRTDSYGLVHAIRF